MHVDDRHPVEVLAEEFSQRLRRGENPAVEEYVARLPEHAELLRQVLAPIYAIERVGTDELSQRQFDSQTYRLAQSHPLLGDFRIVRQVGRGGMGVVYEAIQLSLNRRVALKVLSPQVANSAEEFRRFQLEATAVAQLHHTNIVPIYGVGEAEGLHFYAMQFIDGITLSEAIARLSRGNRLGKRCAATKTETDTEARREARAATAAASASVSVSVVSVVSVVAAEPGGTAGEVTVVRLPSDRVQRGDLAGEPGRLLPANTDGFVWERCELAATWSNRVNYFRTVARVGHALADAVAHAHQQGIVHRDIKPANLLLDQHGIWLTDFGVAKLSSEATQTRTGLLVGTLRYMAPEQFTGETDARSDIYSLGLTLVELITLRPAFGDLTHAGLVQAKTRADGVNPAWFGDCPRDLATIVLKACAPEPVARYATAAALADDLQRFLDDRSISARRISPVERLVRWGRRNPATAALIGGVAMSLLALAGVFARGNYQLSAALDDLRVAKQVVDENIQAKTSALATAEQQRTLAAANLALSIEAFEEIMRNVGSRGGAEALSVELNDGEVAYATGVVSEADAEVLRTLLRFFERFSLENATDLSAETAAVHRRAGDVLTRLGRPGDAEAAYRAALDHYSRLVVANERDASQNGRLLIEQMRLFNALAQTAALQGELEPALEHYRSLFDLYRSQPQAVELDEARFEFARGLNAKTSLIVRMGGSVSRGLPRDTRMAFLPNLLNEPASEDREAGGAGGGRRTGAGLANLARQVHRDAQVNNQNAIEVLSQLSQQHPARVDYALELAHAYREQARLARNELDPVSASESLRHALELLEQLLDKHPDSPYLRFVYADAVTTLAPSQARRNGISVARAVQIAHALAKEYPQVPDFAALKAKTLLVRNDRGAIGQSIELMSTLVESYPDMQQYRLILANGLQRLATLQREANDLDAARKTLRRGIEVMSFDSEGDEPTWLIGVQLQRLKQQLEGLGDRERKFDASEPAQKAASDR